jgi:hypothetical protein
MKISEAASILVEKHIFNNSYYAKLFLKNLKNGACIPLTVFNGSLYKLHDDGYELTHDASAKHIHLKM